MREYETLESGYYKARLVQVIEMGQQTIKGFKGAPDKQCDKVKFVFETPEFFIKEDGVNTSNPRWMSEKWGLPWYGVDADGQFKQDGSTAVQVIKALDSFDECGSDIEKVLGMACYVYIEKYSYVKNGNTIEGNNVKINKSFPVKPMRERDAEALAPLASQGTYFTVTKPDMEFYNRLPDFVRKSINIPEGNIPDGCDDIARIEAEVEAVMPSVVKPRPEFIPPPPTIKSSVTNKAPEVPVAKVSEALEDLDVGDDWDIPF